MTSMEVSRNFSAPHDVAKTAKQIFVVTSWMFLNCLNVKSQQRRKQINTNPILILYIPMVSMYGIFYIYLHLPYFPIKKQPNVGKYTSPMDGMGLIKDNIFRIGKFHCEVFWHPLLEGDSINQDWLVVSTHLKNISQMGSFPQVGVKIKNIWNHHLEEVLRLIAAYILFRPIGCLAGRALSDCHHSEVFASYLHLHMDVSKNSGTPKWMVYNGKPY